MVEQTVYVLQGRVQPKLMKKFFCWLYIYILLVIIQKNVSEDKLLVTSLRISLTNVILTVVKRNIKI